MNKKKKGKPTESRQVKSYVFYAQLFPKSPAATRKSEKLRIGLINHILLGYFLDMYKVHENFNNLTEERR
jgi:hypothetical protein